MRRIIADSHSAPPREARPPPAASPENCLFFSIDNFFYTFTIKSFNFCHFKIRRKKISHFSKVIEVIS